MRFVYVFVSRYGDHRDLHVLTHSFPTRRSSDLARFHGHTRSAKGSLCSRRIDLSGRPATRRASCARHLSDVDRQSSNIPARGSPRSEEHTSELQSLMRISYAVFCLKKKIHQNTQSHT